MDEFLLISKRPVEIVLLVYAENTVSHEKVYCQRVTGARIGAA